MKSATKDQQLPGMVRPMFCTSIDSSLSCKATISISTEMSSSNFKCLAFGMKCKYPLEHLGFFSILGHTFLFAGLR